MKKLKLDPQQFAGNQVLSRDEMRKIQGGQKGSTDCPDGQVPCNCSSSSGSFSGCADSAQDCWNKC